MQAVAENVLQSGHRNFSHSRPLLRCHLAPLTPRGRSPPGRLLFLPPPGEDGGSDSKAGASRRFSFLLLFPQGTLILRTHRLLGKTHGAHLEGCVQGCCVAAPAEALADGQTGRRHVGDLLEGSRWTPSVCPAVRRAGGPPQGPASLRTTSGLRSGVKVMMSRPSFLQQWESDTQVLKVGSRPAGQGILRFPEAA